MTKNIQILHLHIQVLKLLFLWPKDCLTRNQNMFLNYGYFFLNTCCNVSVVWAVAYQLSVGIDNLNMLIEALIGVCDIIGYMVVYIFILKNQEIIEKLIRDINVFLKFCDRKVIEEIDEECVRYTKYLLVYVTIGVFLNLGLTRISTDHCIISRGSDFYLKHDPCGMVTQHFYPFDASKPHIFWILFGVEACYCFHICCEFSLVTATVVGLLMHIIAQLNNCGKMFKEVFDEREDNFQLEIKLVTCAKYHQAILEYSERCCEIFSNMLMIYLTMTSCVLAVISYQIADSSTTMLDKFRYSMLLLGWVLLFFLISFYAQKLENESVKIADSAYNSKWHEEHINTQLRKDLGLVIMRAQKPLNLKVKYMGTMSLVRFVSVLKTAYSFFTLLLTVTDE